MGQRFRQFMYGRYGGDQLNVFLIIFALVVSIASNFLTKLGPWPYYVCVGVSWAILIFALYRMFSKQIYKRQRENARYLKVWYPVKNFFIRLFKKRPDAATHKHFRCPNCRQEVRVPKNKGKIKITCPRCGEKFTRNT